MKRKVSAMVAIWKSKSETPSLSAERGGGSHWLGRLLLFTLRYVRLAIKLNQCTVHTLAKINDG